MRNIKYIVAHHSASPASITTNEKIYKWHADRGYDKEHSGYHVFIDASGLIYYNNSYDKMVWHSEGENSVSIGVCLAGNFENEMPNAQQLSSFVQVVNEIKQQYNNAVVVAHTDMPGAATLCPGINFINWLKENDVK